MGVGAQFSRLKNWIEKEILNNTDLNAEFNNILQNLKPAKLDDYSLTVSQMRETLSPGTVSAETQATTLAEELKQLRYMIKSLSGTTQWYTAPDATLNGLNSLLAAAVVIPANRVDSGKIDSSRFPIWLDPGGNTQNLRLDAASTNLVVHIANVQRTFSADITLSSLSLAPGSNNTATLNSPGIELFEDAIRKGSAYFPVDAVGTEISNLAGKVCAFKINTEYFVGEYDSSESAIKNIKRAFFFDSTQTWVGASLISDNDTITLLKMGWVFGTHDGSTAGLDVTYNQPSVSYDAPASPATGDYWLDLPTGLWKRFSSGWTAQNAVLIGYCAQNASYCLAARSADIFKSFSSQSSLGLELISSTVISSTTIGAKVSVYGGSIFFETSKITWDLATDLDGSLANSSVNYLYITDQGNVKISSAVPYDRRADLFGYYHPGKPWRAVGYFSTDAGGNIMGNVHSFDDPPPVAGFNHFYNGDFQLWQRGTSTTITNTNSRYQADRWYAKNALGTNGILTFSRVTASHFGGNYGASVKITTAPTAAQVNGCELYQSFDAIDSHYLNGKAGTFTAWIKGLGNVTSVGIQGFYKTTEGKVDTAYGDEVSVTVDSDLTFATAFVGFPFDIASPGVYSFGVRIRILGVSSGNTYDLNNGFVIEEAQLRAESNPSSEFNLRNLTANKELEACQRFYEKSYSQEDFVGDATQRSEEWRVAAASNALSASIRFKVEKRKTIGSSDIVFYSPNTGTSAKFRSNGTDRTANFGFGGTSGATMTGTASAGGEACEFHWAVDADL